MGSAIFLYSKFYKIGMDLNHRIYGVCVELNFVLYLTELAYLWLYYKWRKNRQKENLRESSKSCRKSLEKIFTNMILLKMRIGVNWTRMNRSWNMMRTHMPMMIPSATTVQSQKKIIKLKEVEARRGRRSWISKKLARMTINNNRSQSDLKNRSQARQIKRNRILLNIMCLLGPRSKLKRLKYLILWFMKRTFFSKHSMKGSLKKYIMFLVGKLVKVRNL